MHVVQIYCPCTHLRKTSKKLAAGKKLIYTSFGNLKKMLYCTFKKYSGWIKISLMVKRCIQHCFTAFIFFPMSLHYIPFHFKYLSYSLLLYSASLLPLLYHTAMYHIVRVPIPERAHTSTFTHKWVILTAQLHIKAMMLCALNWRRACSTAHTHQCSPSDWTLEVIRKQIITRN